MELSQVLWASSAKNARDSHSLLSATELKYIGSKCLLTTGVAQCEKMFHSVIAGLAPRGISCGRNRLPGAREIHTQSRKQLTSSLSGPKAPPLYEQVLLIHTEVSIAKGRLGGEVWASWPGNSNQLTD